jgi:Mg-chelatase subunit ChlD
MFRWWAFWRRVQYGIGFFLLLGLVGTSVYFKYMYAAPTCSDTIMNGTEQDVDCGGACARVCAVSIIKPVVLWAESFKIVEGQYNVVAYVENKNKTAGTARIGYTFTLYDEEGYITERTGETSLPSSVTTPLFEGRVQTGMRIPTRTTLTFDDASWVTAYPEGEKITVNEYTLLNADSDPRLTAEIYNTDLVSFSNIEVVTTIFDSKRKPLTASRTFVKSLPGRESQSVTFTWPEPIATTLRSCEVPTDVVLAIDLSGSMNNDGGQPPEPVTSVLTAAKSFISRLQEHDQVGLVTYATKASLIAMLTRDIDHVADTVTSLAIDPKEETGNTNTGEALMYLTQELSSVRHNNSARKVAILLTDGLATAPKDNPDVYAQTHADALKATGAQLFTIGIGADLNEIFLKSLASTPAQYYRAPSIREVDTIYSDITKAICEDGPSIVEIVPKVIPTFPPLQ